MPFSDKNVFHTFFSNLNSIDIWTDGHIDHAISQKLLIAFFYIKIFEHHIN